MSGIENGNNDNELTYNEYATILLVLFHIYITVILNLNHFSWIGLMISIIANAFLLFGPLDSPYINNVPVVGNVLYLFTFDLLIIFTNNTLMVFKYIYKVSDKISISLQYDDNHVFLYFLLVISFGLVLFNQKYIFYLLFGLSATLLLNDVNILNISNKWWKILIIYSFISFMISFLCRIYKWNNYFFEKKKHIYNACIFLINLLFLFFVVVYFVFFKYYRVSFDFGDFKGLFNFLFSKWIFIPYVFLLLFFIYYGFINVWKKWRMIDIDYYSYSSDEKKKNRIIVFDTFIFLIFLLFYLLLFVLYKNYTSYNLLIIMAFVISSKYRLNKKMDDDSIISEMILEIIMFFNLCLTVLCVRNGLLILLLYVLVIECYIKHCLKLFTKKRDASFESILIGKNNIFESVNALLNQKFFWLSVGMHAYILMLAILSTKSCFSTPYYQNIGIPNNNALILFVFLLVYFAVISILFKKNPMNIHASYRMLLCVFVVFIFAMSIFVRGLYSEIKYSDELSDKKIILYVDYDDHMNEIDVVEIYPVISFVNVCAAKFDFANKYCINKNTIMKCISPVFNNSYTHEKIIVYEINNNREMSIKTFWYPRLLERVFDEEK